MLLKRRKIIPCFNNGDKYNVFLKRQDKRIIQSFGHGKCKNCYLGEQITDNIFNCLGLYERKFYDYFYYDAVGVHRITDLCLIYDTETYSYIIVKLNRR